MTSAAKKTVDDLLSRTRAAGLELEEGIRTLREEIAVLKSSRLEFLMQPVPIEEAHARIDATIAQLDAVAGQNMRFSVNEFTKGPGHFAGFNFRPELHVNVLMMALGPLIADRWKSDLAQHYAGITPLSAQARDKEIAAIERRIMDSELAEEAIIRVAERAGFAVLRRRDAHPAAVLAHADALP